MKPKSLTCFKNRHFMPMSIQMENTADEITGFYLSILDYERKLLMLTRREETE